MKSLDGKAVLGKKLPKEYMADKTEYEITLTGLEVQALYGLFDRPQVVIHLDGGLVRSVATDTPGLRFRVLDHDLEGGDPKEIQRVDGERVLITQDAMAELNRPHVGKAFDVESYYLTDQGAGNED